MEWARTTITSWTGDAGPDRHDMAGDSLESQLDEAERLLTRLDAADRRPDLVRLVSSWSPEPGQHAITLSAGLVSASHS